MAVFHATKALLVHFLIPLVVVAAATSVKLTRRRRQVFGKPLTRKESCPPCYCRWACLQGRRTGRKMNAPRRSRRESSDFKDGETCYEKGSPKSCPLVSPLPWLYAQRFHCISVVLVSSGNSLLSNISSASCIFSNGVPKVNSGFNVQPVPPCFIPSFHT